jgi:hypothetical protein
LISVLFKLNAAESLPHLRYAIKQSREFTAAGGGAKTRAPDKPEAKKLGAVQLWFPA